MPADIRDGWTHLRLRKRTESLTSGGFALSVVTRLLQDISYFPVVVGTVVEAGARGFQSHQQHELMQRGRAVVSMTTFEGCIIKTLSKISVSVFQFSFSIT